MRQLTPDASGALDQAGLSRRTFLKGAGALIVAFSSGVVVNRIGLLAQGLNGVGGPLLDSWIAIGQDGGVTAYTGKCDIGTGLYTAQTQLVAEEMGVSLGQVRLVECDTSITPDQGTTSGQQSHLVNFNQGNLALAAATAREALVRLAEERLGVPASDLVARDGGVALIADASRRITYGALIGGRRFNLSLDDNAKRRHPRDWTVLGTSVHRLDMRDMVTGRFGYVHNVRVDGMLHGQVVRPPEVGATLAGVAEQSVQDLPGLVDVVVKGDFVGVVAERPWQALQAAERLAVSWRPGNALLPPANLYAWLREQTVNDTLHVDSGDVDARLADAATVRAATYRHPYQMHGSVGSSCAVADVQSDRATLWSATQAVFPMRNTAAAVLGLDRENVRVIFTRGAGCYGINGADTVTYDAALLSQAVGRPVRVQLSRKDEMAWENFGYPFVIDQRVGLDGNGSITVWDYEGWSAAKGARPGYRTPGNVVTGSLVGFPPQPFTPRTPAPPPAGPLDNGRNTVPSYVTGQVGGTSRGSGVVPSERVLSHLVQSPFFTGPLRSPWRLQNTFAHECFMDEVAAYVGADPVEYRRRHLGDAQLSAVVAAAAGTANWSARPSPLQGRPATGVARGRGMACVWYEGDNSYVAMVAEVDVDQETGEVHVARLIVALDAGPISNPDGIRNQLEGGALQGMSRALGEEVTWDDRTVTSIDWRTYRVLPVGFALPTIEIVLIDQPDAVATGAGETAITVTAPAIGNAIFDATGARVREIPFTPERVRAALAARSPQL